MEEGWDGESTRSGRLGRAVVVVPEYVALPSGRTCDRDSKQCALRRKVHRSRGDCTHGGVVCMACMAHDA